jgi:hypothetical protein
MENQKLNQSTVYNIVDLPKKMLTSLSMFLAGTGEIKSSGKPV